MIKQEKFEIVNRIKSLIVYLENNLENFPKRDLELKHKLNNEIYDLLKKCYLANETTNKDKKYELQYELISTVRYVDFLINLCYEKKIINHKKYLQIGERLDNILKYIMGWIKYTQNVKQQS